MIIDTEQYISAVAFAEKLGVFTQKVMYYVYNKRIPAIRFDGRWYIDKKELKNWPPKLKRQGRPRKETLVQKEAAKVQESIVLNNQNKE